MSKTVDEVGHIKIKRRERFQSGSANGLRPGWSEFQVWEGRKIISRHDTYAGAYASARALLNSFWDEQARQLSVLRQGGA